MKEKEICGDTPNSPRDTAESADIIQGADELGLLLRAKNGDDDAFSALVDNYTPMLSAAAAQYRGEVSDQDLEEISQEALLAFHRAIMRYDPLRGNVKFGLYAKVCVNKAIISALRKISRTKKHIEYLPLDDAPGNSEASPADSVIEREKERSLRRLINDNLSEYESAVWWLCYSGIGTDEIAVRTGRSKKSVENALSRVRRKLRAFLTQNKQ